MPALFGPVPESSWGVHPTFCKRPKPIEPEPGEGAKAARSSGEGILADSLSHECLESRWRNSLIWVWLFEATLFFVAFKGNEKEHHSYLGSPKKTPILVWDFGCQGRGFQHHKRRGGFICPAKKSWQEARIGHQYHLIALVKNSPPE